MSRKMSPHQQSPRLRQLQQQLAGGAPPLRTRNGGSPRQNGGGARVADIAQTPQVIESSNKYNLIRISGIIITSMKGHNQITKS